MIKISPSMLTAICLMCKYPTLKQGKKFNIKKIEEILEFTNKNKLYEEEEEILFIDTLPF